MRYEFATWWKRRRGEEPRHDNLVFFVFVVAAACWIGAV